MPHTLSLCWHSFRYLDRLYWRSFISIDLHIFVIRFSFISLLLICFLVFLHRFKRRRFLYNITENHRQRSSRIVDRNDCIFSCPTFVCSFSDVGGNFLLSTRRPSDAHFRTDCVVISFISYVLLLKAYALFRSHTRTCPSAHPFRFIICMVICFLMYFLFLILFFLVPFSN